MHSHRDILIIVAGLALICTFTINAMKTENFRTLKLDPKINYKTLYFKQQVDHFAYSNEDTFEQRYLVADQHWDHNGGPIFFYAGNEGDITWFCNNTGAMWDWAPGFKAMLVFAEHRYYGKSMPYGKDSYKDLAHLGYLSSEQALADFAVLIDYLRQTIPGAGNSPVVAFGGSYGGMLAAWLRMKYPHSVIGSLAASAPLWYFGDIVPCGTFNHVTTKDFQITGPHCADNVRKSWAAIDKMGKTASGRSQLSRTFKLCKPLQTSADVGTLKGWLAASYGNLAMVDYPIPANFLEPLPAHPIKVACSQLQMTNPSDGELLAGLYNIVNVYFNFTGSARCLNTTQQGTSSLGDQGWNFQACSEMVMPMCSDGIQDMFEPSQWSESEFAAGCKKQFGVVTRPRWAIQEYGGRNITAASNIIFSNGLLDPWSGGGVMKSLTPSLVAIVIKDGAHHYDLRAADPKDTPAVIAARKQEREIIEGWIKQYKNKDIRPVVGASALSLFPQDGTWEENRLTPPGAIALLMLMVIFGIGCLSIAVYMGLVENPMGLILRKTRKGIKKNVAFTKRAYDNTNQAVVMEEKTPLL